METAAPTPHRLAGLVESCVGFDLRTAPDARHHGLPSPAGTLIVAFADPLDCGWSDGSQRGRWRLLVAGLHDRPALIRAHGRMAGVQLALTPRGARALLGVPIGALAGTLASGSAVGLPEARLADTESLPWPRRLAAVQDALASLLRLAPEPAPEVAEAWRLLRARAGRVRIDALAEHVGWSRRRLGRAFSAEYGMSPKRAAEIARFDRARALVDAGTGLAEASLRAGYADQAHLTRSWRGLAGTTPTATLRESPTFKTPPTETDRITP